MGVNIKGIDVSKYQGNIDFNKVKSSGVEFVIIRAGYGKLISQKDPKFEQNYSRAKAAGLNVGAYWYSYATDKSSAEQEANVFLEVVKGKQFEYPLYLDYEDKTQNSSSIANAVIPTFLNILESKGYYAGLYSYYYMFKDVIPDEYEKRYTVWLAQYSSSTKYSGHKIWQYSSTGKVDGISGNVDMNVSLFDFATEIKSMGLNGFLADTTKSESKVTEPFKPVVNQTISESSKLKTFLSNRSEVKLDNDQIFTSSSVGSSYGRKTGIFYIYSNDVVNGRVRITNSKSNVGKTPIGNYVTGWVEINSVDSMDNTVVKSPTSNSASIYSKGSKVILSNVSLYSSSSSKNLTSHISGNYWLYDGVEVNGRYRVTNSQSNVGKTPIGKYVTGFISKNDI